MIIPPTGDLKRHMPRDGEVFELTLDGNAAENQPLEMLRLDGFDPPLDSGHNGPIVVGKQTRHFKFVTVGYQTNRYELYYALIRHGKTPEGQWREAWKKKFEIDGKHPRGVADFSWIMKLGRACYPCCPVVRWDGISCYLTDEDLHKYHGLRWLIEE